MEMLIPITAIALSIGGPLAIVVVVLAQQHKQQIMINQLVTNAVAAGRSPEEVREMINAIRGKAAGSTGKGSLKAGIILTAIGLGIALIAPITGDMEALGGSGFVVLLGIAFMVIWFFIDKPKPQK